MISTEVLVRGPAHFDMGGKLLHYPLHEVDEAISQGLANRLLSYATKRLQRAGLILDGWKATVSTMDGDKESSRRSYSVSWVNAENTQISVDGILTSHGWPFLDHGLDIQEDV